MAPITKTEERRKVMEHSSPETKGFACVKLEERKKSRRRLRQKDRNLDQSSAGLVLPNGKEGKLSRQRSRQSAVERDLGRTDSKSPTAFSSADRKESKKSTSRRRGRSASKSSTLSRSATSSSSRKARRQGSGVSHEVKTMFIDSEVLKDRSARRYRRSRSQSMVKGYRSHNLQLSPFRLYCEPEMVKVPSGAYRCRASSTASSSNLSSSTTNGFSSKTTSSSFSSSSSDTSFGDSSRVKIIRVNQNNAPDYVDNGRMFVFDSYKYRIEELPSRRKHHYQHQQGYSRDRQNRNMGWTRDGESFIAYPGKDSRKIFLVRSN
ncbi:hypothetical protein ACTXT7_012117 [Hymenolepis weldensis]